MLDVARSGLTGVAVNRDFRLSYEESLQDAGCAEEVPLQEPSDLLDVQFAPLMRAIETEIIPRLMFAHRLVDSPPIPQEIRLEKPTQAEVFELTQLLLAQEASQSADFVEALRDKGVMQESLYLELLAPAARCLGELWESDECNFVEVTIALGRLHQVLRTLSLTSDRPDHNELGVREHKVLLAPMPGEQHVFGLAIVAEFFQRAGWDVCSSDQKMSPDPYAIVRAEWFDAAGFSAGTDCRLDELAVHISAIRAASLNRNIVILVGGPLFVNHPEFTALVGADASAPDAQLAVVAAENLIASRRRLER